MRRWQDRIGQLLRQSCPYVYRPVDSAFHGGQARIDFLALASGGRFVMVEVKETPNQQHFTFSGVKLTPMQQGALTTVTDGGGEAYLAVGAGDRVLWYDWAKISDREPSDRIFFEDADWAMDWQGPKEWKTRQVLLA